MHRQQVRRRRRQVSNEDRQRIVTCFENGDDHLLLADNLGVNRDTARSIIRIWMAEARTERLPQGGARHVVVDQEMIDMILQITSEEPFTTLVKLNEKLQNRLPDKPRVHPSTIDRHLQNQLISVKLAGKDADVPMRRNTPETKALRFQYMTWLSNLDVNSQIIYIDECGFNTYTRRNQGRAPVGERVRQRVGGIRGRNINLILAINADVGLVYFELQQQTLNHERYQEFINHLVTVEAAPRFPDRVHIVQDGARPHLNTVIPEQHRELFDVRTLPPYSPFLNPVEQANSCFKNAISRQLRTRALQDELIDEGNRRLDEGLTQEAWRSRILMRLGREAINEITQAKCSNWCRRVHRFIAPSLAREDIDG